MTVQIYPVFYYHQTPLTHCLLLASYHMEGQALIWFQDLEDSGVLKSWEVFVQALLMRFGPSAYDDPMEMLTRLRQTSSVEL